MLELAADDACPKQPFFVHVLFLMIGDAVRTDYGAASREQVDALLARSTKYAHPWIAAWRAQSRELIAAPKTFAYVDWCDGGLARGLAGDD